MKQYFQSSPRTTHSVASGMDVKNIPSLPANRPQQSKPAPLVNRCASCGGRRK